MNKQAIQIQRIQVMMMNKTMGEIVKEQVEQQTIREEKQLYEMLTTTNEMINSLSGMINEYVYQIENITDHRKAKNWDAVKEYYEEYSKDARKLEMLMEDLK